MLKLLNRHPSSHIQLFRSFNRAADRNSFQTAANLGTVKANRSFSAKVKSTVGSEDAADFYKYKVRPNVQSTSFLDLRTADPFIRLETFLQVGQGKIRRQSVSIVKRDDPLVTGDSLVNLVDRPLTFYYKLTPVLGDATYRLELFITPTPFP